MKIIQLPDPVLRKTTKPVIELSPKVVNLIKEMITTLSNKKNPQGVGLAAPQVGASLQIFIIKPPINTTSYTQQTTSNKQKIKIRNQQLVISNYNSLELFINPKIIKTEGEYKSAKSEENLEGCLSLHGYYGPIKRAASVVIEYVTLDPDSLYSIKPSSPLPSSITKTFSGFPAVIIQHEMDHLNGKLFVDRILEQKGKLYKVGKDDKGKEVLDEVQI